MVIDSYYRDYDPGLRRIARVLPRGINRYTLPVVRPLLSALPLRKPSDVEVLTLPRGAGVRLHRAPAVSGDCPALLWMHGGGYVIGSAAQDDALCRRFSHRLGATVAAVEYRLAPKHPYPAALEDCYEALTWLARLPGVDSTRIAVGGASAGGGLAAALALLARDRGEVAPRFQLLAYPMVDDRSSDLPRDRRYRMWNPDANRLAWSVYLQNADPAIAVPARRSDLTGLAPAWVGVGTLDLFQGEDVEYVRQLRAAGVPCELVIVEGAFHVFDAVAPSAPVSRAFFDRQCEVLRKAFAA